MDMTNKGATQNMARNQYHKVWFCWLWFPCLHKGNENKALEQKILYTRAYVGYLSVIYIIILTQ